MLDLHYNLDAHSDCNENTAKGQNLYQRAIMQPFENDRYKSTVTSKQVRWHWWPI